MSNKKSNIKWGKTWDPSKTFNPTKKIGKLKWFDHKPGSRIKFKAGGGNISKYYKDGGNVITGRD